MLKIARLIKEVEWFPGDATVDAEVLVALCRVTPFVKTDTSALEVLTHLALVGYQLVVNPRADALFPSGCFMRKNS